MTIHNSISVLKNLSTGTYNLRTIAVPILDISYTAFKAPEGNILQAASISSSMRPYLYTSIVKILSFTMDLSNDPISIDSSTGISTDGEPISEKTASPAAGQPPSPNYDNKTSCGYDTYHCPDTSTNKSISELTASPAAGTPPSPNDDNTPRENMHHFPNNSTNKLISELSESPETGPLPSPNDDNSSCENIHRYSDTATNKPIPELSASPAAEPPPLPNHHNTPCEKMHHFPNNSTDKSTSELTGSPIAGLPSSQNHNRTSFVDNMYRYPDTFKKKSISKLPTIYENKPIVEHVTAEAGSTPLQNRDQNMSCRINMNSNPTDFMGKPKVNIPPLAQNENACLYVVLCPSDGGFWPKITCTLGFLSLFVVDGICSSFFLLDSRVGMAEYLPPGTYTLEHLAVYTLRSLITNINRNGSAELHHYLCVSHTDILYINHIHDILFAEPFSCAYINRYGIGMGMIKTSFYVLLSTMFVVNCHTAHLSLHLGSISGMTLMTRVTEFCLLYYADWKTALHIHLCQYKYQYSHIHNILMCFTLVFWLFIATPVPIKIEAIDNKVINDPVSPHRLKTVTTVWNVKNFAKKYQPPTINTEIGDQQ
ncbi:Uncharacterized protein FWK35_00022182 [Aphis craccivora]|uniref:Uncharacterized protein n=1 Tax=Aphis craccivora TaxID=307492 RepID=A0A6G0YTD3_APHCR|nr:Uncharacterized protein FWK35_00022182 [Aphis craccivora]